MSLGGGEGGGGRERRCRWCFLFFFVPGKQQWQPPPPLPPLFPWIITTLFSFPFLPSFLRSLSFNNAVSLSPFSRWGGVQAGKGWTGPLASPVKDENRSATIPSSHKKKNGVGGGTTHPPESSPHCFLEVSVNPVTTMLRTTALQHIDVMRMKRNCEGGGWLRQSTTEQREANTGRGEEEEKKINKKAPAVDRTGHPRWPDHDACCKKREAPQG